MGTPRFRPAAGLATLLPMWILGGCLSGPQVRDFALTEATRAVSELVVQLLGTLISTTFGT